jgi:hypothetical protein
VFESQKSDKIASPSIPTPTGNAIGLVLAFMTPRSRASETKSYLFIKLPDRILLIDPDTKTVAEIVGAPATTGSQSGASPTNSGAPSR